MGKNRNPYLQCEHCDKRIRQDKMKRHVNFQHLRHVNKERKIFNLSEKMIEKMKEVAQDVEKFRKTTDFDKNKIGRFGNFEFLYGNLQHKDVRKAIIRAHYNWMTVNWAQEVDNLNSSDEGCYEWYVDNGWMFSEPKTRWAHVLTNDPNLYKTLSEQEQPNYKIIPGQCACLCNEIAATPLRKSEVDKLVLEKAYHYHFAVECKVLDKPRVLGWCQSFLSHNVTDAWCKGANKGFGITVLDRMRIHHYLHRREASIGLPLHFFIHPLPRWRWQPYTGFWKRVEEKLPLMIRNINSALIAEAQLECTLCRKAASGYCFNHVDYLHDQPMPVSAPAEGVIPAADPIELNDSDSCDSE